MTHGSRQRERRDPDYLVLPVREVFENYSGTVKAGLTTGEALEFDLGPSMKCSP
jgi:hypothetical protein